MTEDTRIRITFKRSRPNPIFECWLKELHEEASSKKSKLEPMLKEALTSISKYPLPLLTGSECAILSGFDKRLCQFLDSRLEVYNNDKKLEPYQPNKPTSNENSSNNINIPQTVNGNQISDNNQNVSNIEEAIASTSQSSCNSNSPQQLKPSQNRGNKRARKTKQYKPAHRSGGYAILLGLLENQLGNPINKGNLIEIAQKYSEESFVRPKPESFYTAWSNMSKLVTKGLVIKHGTRKATYTLSEEGLKLAKELLEESNTTPTMNNIIFNDNVIRSNFRSPKNPVVEVNQNIVNKDNEIPTTSRQPLDESPILEMLPGTFDVILIIDVHETNGLSKKTDPTVAQFKKYPDLNPEYKSLKVGDYTWIARDKVDKEKEFVLPYVVERKRMDDLGASIKDGRFHEQKFRLKKSGLKNIIYLVENYGSNKHVGLPVQSLMQALANTRVQDGFKVHITDSQTHSTRFLAMMTKRLTIEFKDKALKGHNQEPNGDILPTFTFFNKSSLKNRPLSVTDTFIKLLLQLKGVSVEKALAITSVYKTPSSLFKAYEGCDDDKEGELLLANLKYNNVCNNVGLKVSKSIYQLFTFNNYI